MNLNYGGVGGKKLRDSELTDDDVGDKDATMYEIVDKGGKVKSSIHEPTEVDNVTITHHDCRVYTGDI